MTEIFETNIFSSTAMIKVISTLLRNSPDNIHIYDIKYRFLDDLILLSSVSHENRRLVNFVSRITDVSVMDLESFCKCPSGKIIFLVWPMFIQ